MATNAKLIIGYTDHIGYWNVTEAYYRHYDGYSEAIVPLLREYTTAETGVDIDAINADAEYDSHKFEKLENSFDFGRTNYVYYIDESNRAKIRVTVLKEDIEFFNKFMVDNYEVEQEFCINL